MRRWCLLVVSSSLVITVGCGQESYTKRLDATLARLERERRIAKNLMPAPTDKKFQELSIYLRAPKDEAQTKTGQLPVGEGQFDLDASFVDKADAKLHVLARVKLPKKPQAKGVPPAPAPVARGDFPRDVLAILTGEFGSVEGLTTPKFVDENKRGNRFKRLVVTANEKEVKLYTFKQDNYDVALVFVYDPKLRGVLSTKIDLSLETFATGPKAARNYSGSEPEEEDASGGVAVPL